MDLRLVAFNFFRGASMLIVAAGATLPFAEKPPHAGRVRVD